MHARRQKEGGILRRWDTEGRWVVDKNAEREYKRLLQMEQIDLLRGADVIL